MAEKKIAESRLYRRDAAGREVLAAAPGQAVPDGVEFIEPQAAETDNSGAAKPRSGGKRAAAKSED